MNNYLERLVERTLGTGALVQPLVAPRFSSAPVLGGEFGEVWEKTEATTGVPSETPVRKVSDEGDRSRELSSLLTPVESSSQIEDLSQPLGTLHRQETIASSRPNIQQDSQIAGFIPHETLPTLGSYEVPPEIAAEIKGGSIDDNIVEKSETLQSARSGEDQGAASPSRMVQGEDDSGIKKYAPVIPRHTGIDPSLESSGEVTLETTVVESRVKSVYSEPDIPPRFPDMTIPELSNLVEHSPTFGSPTLPPVSEIATHPAPQSAPVIRVTIGRIEVRAVAPEVQSPRPRSPRPKPALSLENYLKQRNGGE